MAFLWVVTLLGAIVGGLVFVGTMMGAKSAPQEAAGFAMAMACVVIPYVFTRACEGLAVGAWQRKLVDAVEDLGRRMQASSAAGARQQATPLAASGPASATHGFRTTQQSLDALRAGGATVKTHNGGWEIVAPGGLKHYAYNDNDLNKWADRYGAAAPAAATSGSALDRLAASGWTAGQIKE